jgi:hypothetical protein
VLEQVREPGLARRLDAASDVVGHVHGHEGNAALRRHDDGEAIREALDVEGDVEIDLGSDRVLLMKPGRDPFVI